MDQVRFTVYIKAVDAFEARAKLGRQVGMRHAFITDSRKLGDGQCAVDFQIRAGHTPDSVERDLLRWDRTGGSLVSWSRS